MGNVEVRSVVLANSALPDFTEMKYCIMKYKGTYLYYTTKIGHFLSGYYSLITNRIWITAVNLNI